MLDAPILSVPTRPVSLRRPGGRLGVAALAGLWLGLVVIVLLSAGGAAAVAPHPGHHFPAWMAGPLAHVLSHGVVQRLGTQGVYSGLLALLLGAYLIAVAAARSIRPAYLIAFVVGSAAILFLGPPTRLNDVFNYLGYARLGAVHHLNPYTHVIRDEHGDPVVGFTSWRNLASPYGPLFTAFTYPLAKLSLPASYWTYKACAVLGELAEIWLVASCARALGRDWRLPVLFIAANPLYLCFEVAGFHNDFLMLVPATAAILLAIRERDASAGAVLMLAVAVKFTAIILAPFLIVAAVSHRRRLRLLAGMAVGAAAMVLLSVALFGLSLPNLSDQSGLVTGFSVPNLLGLALGQGGATPLVIRGLEVVVVLCVLWRLRGRDWITSAGGCTLALIASIAWLMPWYLVWVLPLAAIAGSRPLRWAALVATLFLLVTFAPAVSRFFNANGLNPMDTRFGRSAQVFQQRLEADPSGAGHHHRFERGHHQRHHRRVERGGRRVAHHSQPA